MASDSRVSPATPLPRGKADPEARRVVRIEQPTAVPAGGDAAAPAGVQAATPAVADQRLASQAGPAPAPPAGDSHGAAGGLDGQSRFLLLQAIPSWAVSMILHVVILVLLALISLPDQPIADRIVALARISEEAEEVEELKDDELQPVDMQVLNDSAPLQLAAATDPQAESMPEFNDLDAAPQRMELSDLGDQLAPKNDLMATIGSVTGRGLEGRGAKARKEMVQRYGGTEGSEAAVAFALEWLANHQNRDGSWSFDHQRGICQGRCSHTGYAGANNGATAMGLLPFLGAGQTHKEGKYKENVERGLYFLLRSMNVRNGMGDLTDRDGRLYSHGLASIALCEAYAMTNDPALLQPAQLAVNYIIYAQDPVGGGWRYGPKMPGDTSVVGWQLMALKSGHMAYLVVPPGTVLGAQKFLDYVQAEGGAKYGYDKPGAGDATTAVGLLCRMYLGWKKDEPALENGVKFLAGQGPTENMYYNYYATQVLRHWEGKEWEDWNTKLRDRLVSSQDQQGHAKGSWYFEKDPWADRAGRMYCTSMATMILEVYYRHLPIYGKQAADEEFPL